MCLSLIERAEVSTHVSTERSGDVGATRDATAQRAAARDTAAANSRIAAGNAVHVHRHATGVATAARQEAHRIDVRTGLCRLSRLCPGVHVDGLRGLDRVAGGRRGITRGTGAPAVRRSTLRSTAMAHAVALTLALAFALTFALTFALAFALTLALAFALTLALAFALTFA